ncbi:hypothetical protein GF402_01795 [Candidatus Fermentibacteria bacterium]|nr:hypothetical protein [Candidatus Fermentibacteria bacterium]
MSCPGCGRKPLGFWRYTTLFSPKSLKCQHCGRALVPTRKHVRLVAVAQVGAVLGGVSLGLLAVKLIYNSRSNLLLLAIVAVVAFAVGLIYEITAWRTGGYN